MALPGPDQPPRIKNPRIVRNPGAKSIAGLKKKGYKKAGAKHGRNTYVLARPKAPKPAAPKAPKDPQTGGAASAPGRVDPYSEYAAYPWAQRQFKQIDRDQAAHQDYLSEKVQPWVGQALTNLTGVDPNAPGINPTLQQQYLANIQGVVGGALNSAATATPNMPGATTPGGIMASPTAYLSTAAREGAAARSAGLTQAAQSQAALNTLQPNLMAQGVVRQIADYAKGLPALYAERRNEARSKIDQFLLEFEEGNRRARVSESISAMNAQANIAISLGNLGLDAADTQRRLDEATAEQTAANAAATGEVPYGFVRLPNGNIVRDPSVPTATSGGGGGGGGNKPLSASQISSMNGKWKRPKSSPPKLGPGWKQPVWDSRTKAWYAKRASGSGSKPAKKATSAELQKEVLGYYKPGDVGGWEERYEGNPEGAGKELAYWIRQKKPDFIVSGRKADLAKIRSVLARIGGRPAAEALSILVRGYIDANGNWK